MRISNREYDAWLKKKGLTVKSEKRSSLPIQPHTLSLKQEGPDPGEHIFPFRIVNKANTNVIRFNPRILGTIARLKATYTKMRLWWIGPSEEAKNAQTELALKLMGCHYPTYRAETAVQLHLRIGGHNLDADALKLILDALEEARILDNDNQVKYLTVRVERGDTRSLGVRVEEIDNT